MSSVTEKSSEAYSRKKASLKGATEETGVRRAVREKASAAIARAAQKSQESVVKGLADLKVKTTESLDAISSQLSSEIANLRDVQEAIKAEEANLDNLHKITAEADSLQALILAQKEQRETFEAEMARARVQWAEEKVSHQKVESQYAADLSASRKREAEGHSYETTKRRNSEEDAIQAQRQAAQRAFDDKVIGKSEELADRENAIAAKEAELLSLREQLAKSEEASRKEADKAVAIATNSLKKDLTHEHTLVKMGLENQLNLKTTEIGQLNARIVELSNQNKALDVEYKNASLKVQQIAERAIDGASKQNITVQAPSSDGASNGRRG